MKKNFTVKFLSFCFIFIGLTFAQGVNPGFQINVLSSTNSSTLLEYTVTDYNQKEIDINGVGHMSYDIPGMIQLMEKGLPQLPSMRNSIIISDKSAMNYKILEQEFTTIETLPVMPSKGHFTRDIDPNSVPYTFDAKYNSSAWYPQENIALDVPYIVRDLRGLTVQFNPMQFNAAEGKLKICTRLVVEIYVDKNLQAVNKFERTNPFRGVSKEFDQTYKTLFLNYGVGEFNYVPIPEPGRLLIVYAAPYVNKVTPYANWKIEKGIPTILAEYPTQTGSGNTALKTYIQNLYNSTDGLTYIILVGESNQIPTINGVSEAAPSDPCYVKLAGTDAYPDAYISRISPTSEANLGYILWKIMRYEKYPDGGVNGAWYLKGTGVASNEGSPIQDWKFCDTLRNMLINKMHFTEVDKIYDPGATSSMVTTALNNGRSVLNYIGHGSGTSWGTTGFGNSGIYALTNGYKNPFIWDVACLNGNFTATECMEEAWMRAGDSVNAKGAVAAYGSSTNASWYPPLDAQKESMRLLVTRERQTVGGICFNGIMKGMDLWGGSTGEGLKMMEQYNIFGDCTTMLTFGLYPDSVAPAKINNLACSDPTSNSLTVTWTSPLDSSLGGVVSYDLRYSTTPITNEIQFNGATSKVIAGAPDSAGMSKSYQLNGLSFNTQYYFAIKAKDMWGNVSEMSNTISGTTLSAPLIAVNMDSLLCTMITNSTHTDTILISNNSTANSTLDYTIELTNNVFPGGVKAYSIPVITSEPERISSKENPDLTPGMSIFGHGGPDLFGYEWIDSNEPGGPQYVWNDIAATGTLVPTWTPTSTYAGTDEGKAGPFQIGFPFKYYGSPYSQIWFCSNGWLSFADITNAYMTNATIPNTALPNGVIAPLWDDLDGKSTGQVFYKQEDNKFIVQYNNWPAYSSSGGPYTFQVVLYKSGKIMFYYKSVAGTLTSCTVGIENQAGSTGLQVAYNAAYLANSKAIQFSAEPDWLAPNVTSGRIHQGNSVAIALSMNTDGLELGNYSMDFVVHSNDPVKPIVTVPIKLTINDGTPVEMLGVNSRNNEDEVILEWVTKTETNNKGFQVERKEGSTWRSLGFINGKGTTTESNSYLFSEKVTKAGKYLYRIKQIDLDGTVGYNQVVEVEVTGPKTFSLSQNYPNPFNPSTAIRFTLPIQSNVKLTVYSLLGETVAQITDEVKEAGYYTYNWNAGQLASGMYLLVLEAKSSSGKQEFKSIKKVSLIK